MTLDKSTLDNRFVSDQSRRIIGDKAYDNDPLDERLLQERSIELIAPHRLVRNRKGSPTQDGRQLRRYHRRWKSERLFAWLQHYRRLGLRYEFHLHNFLGMLHLACALIPLRFF